MRTMFRCATLTALAVVIIGSRCAEGQSPVSCTVGVHPYSYAGVSSLKNVPFSATFKMSMEQRLGDGNTIHGSLLSYSARSTDGKTRIESSQNCIRGEDGQPHVTKNVSIFDPVTKRSINWSDSPLLPKVARTYESLPRKPLTEEDVAREKEYQRVAQYMQPPASETHTTDLGIKVIAGVAATGTRKVRTVSAGEEGNDQPFEILNETWISKELGITMMSIQDDPRRGRFTMEVQELDRSEPDASLFVAPAGYRLVEAHVNPETGQIQ